MKSVVMCGSRRFKEGIKEFAEKLRQAGVIVYMPILFESKEDTSVELSEAVQYLRRCGVTFHHLEQIRKADVCFFFNEDHYMGNSTTLELGAAAVLDKPIYALREDTQDPSRGVVIDEIVSTPEELLKRL